MVGVPCYTIGTTCVCCQFFTAFQTGILVIWLFVPSLGHPFNTDQPNCPLRLYCPLLASPARCLPLLLPAVCCAVYRCGWWLSIAAAVDGVLVRLIFEGRDGLNVPACLRPCCGLKSAHKCYWLCTLRRPSWRPSWRLMRPSWRPSVPHAWRLSLRPVLPVQ